MTEFDADELAVAAAAACLTMELRSFHGAVALLRDRHAAVDRWANEVRVGNEGLPEGRRQSIADLMRGAVPVDRATYPNLTPEGAKLDAVLLALATPAEGAP